MLLLWLRDWVFSAACCRVIINTNHKKFEGTLVGKEGNVLSITSNGWVKLQV
jgi:hypothetical protein